MGRMRQKQEQLKKQQELLAQRQAGQAAGTAPPAGQAVKSAATQGGQEGLAAQPAASARQPAASTQASVAAAHPVSGETSGEVLTTGEIDIVSQEDSGPKPPSPGPAILPPSAFAGLFSPPSPAVRPPPLPPPAAAQAEQDEAQAPQVPAPPSVFGPPPSLQQPPQLPDAAPAQAEQEPALVPPPQPAFFSVPPSAASSEAQGPGEAQAAQAAKVPIKKILTYGNTGETQDMVGGYTLRYLKPLGAQSIKVLYAGSGKYESDTDSVDLEENKPRSLTLAGGKITLSLTYEGRVNDAERISCQGEGEESVVTPAVQHVRKAGYAARSIGLGISKLKRQIFSGLFVATVATVATMSSYLKTTLDGAFWPVWSVFVAGIAGLLVWSGQKRLNEVREGKD